MSYFTEFLARETEHKITHRVTIAEAGINASAHAAVSMRLKAIIPPGTPVQVGESNPRDEEDGRYNSNEDYTYGHATWEAQGELP